MLTETIFNMNGIQGTVCYLLNGDTCIFSGITPHTISTVNAAEAIISAIAQAEHLDPRRITFFDLWTRRGYAMLREPYEYKQVVVEFNDELVLKRIRWVDSSCPEHILRSFNVYMN